MPGCSILALTRHLLARQRYDLWNDSMKATLRDFALAQMDTFQVRVQKRSAIDRQRH